MKKPIITLAISGLMMAMVSVPANAQIEDTYQVQHISQYNTDEHIDNMYFYDEDALQTASISTNITPHIRNTELISYLKYYLSRLLSFSPLSSHRGSIWTPPPTTTSTSTTETTPTSTSSSSPTITSSTTTHERPTTTTRQTIPDVNSLDKAVQDTREQYEKITNDYREQSNKKDAINNEIASLETKVSDISLRVESLEKENIDLNNNINQLNTDKSRLISQRDALNNTSGYTVEQKQAIVAQAIEEMINDYRVKNGFHKLSVHPDLKDSAQNWSKVMARNSTYRNFEGFTHSSRALRGEITGENIVAFTTAGTKQGNDFTLQDLNAMAQQAFNAWENSPGHNDTMLDPTVQIMGIGLVFDKGSVFASTEFNNERFIMDGYSAPRGIGGSTFPQQEATMYKAYIPQGAKEKIGLQNWIAPKDQKDRYIYTSKDIIIGGGPNKQIDRFSHSPIGSDPKIDSGNQSQIDEINKQISIKQSEINTLTNKKKSNTSEINNLRTSQSELNKQLEDKKIEQKNIEEKLVFLEESKSQAYDKYNTALKEREDFKDKYGK